MQAGHQVSTLAGLGGPSRIASSPLSESDIAAIDTEVVALNISIEKLLNHSTEYAGESYQQFIKMSDNSYIYLNPSSYSFHPNLNHIGHADTNITALLEDRAYYAAISNRISSTLETYANSHINLSKAKGFITDANYAKEVSELAKNSVLRQAGMAILAHANSEKSHVLALIKD